MEAKTKVIAGIRLDKALVADDVAKYIPSLNHLIACYSARKIIASTNNLPSPCLHTLAEIRHVENDQDIKLKDAFQSLPNLFPDQWFAVLHSKSFIFRGIYRVVEDARRWRLGEGVNLYTGCVSTPVSAATALDEGRELAHEDSE
ncbi:hypothetical protein Tco_0688424 [Tanacetum coccineum]